MIIEEQLAEVEPAQAVTCIGIDIGKASHVAGFVSENMLDRRHFSKCPTFSFENSRAGFEALLMEIKKYASLDRCMILLEKTGHYGAALEQFLQQQGIMLYKIHVQQRQTKRKNDRQDALYLANKLYNQAILNTQEDALNRIHRALPPSPAVGRLRPLIQHRNELAGSITTCRNRLTALADEIFPELTEVIKDPNTIAALNIRLKFPTPAAIAQASMDELVACRAHTHPGQKALERLQALAKTSIGSVDKDRLFALRLEQSHLIAELRLLQSHIDVVEGEIGAIVTDSREGAILTSIPGISSIHAAIILAHIGSIGSFERASLLRGCCGWAPQESQSGTSLDVVKLAKGGSKLLKQTIYLIAWVAIKQDTEFRSIYERLVPVKCRFDKRTNSYHGKNKVMGRICGQIVGVIYTLLRQDYDLLASLEPGQVPPEPTLYSRDHHRHSLGKDPLPEPIQLPEIGEDATKSEHLLALLAQAPGTRVRDLVLATGLNPTTVSKVRRRWLEENLFNKRK